MIGKQILPLDGNGQGQESLGQAGEGELDLSGCIVDPFDLVPIRGLIGPDDKVVHGILLSLCLGQPGRFMLGGILMRIWTACRLGQGRHPQADAGRNG